MKLLKGLKRAEKQGHGYPIEVQAGLEMLDVEALPRIARRLIDKDIQKIVDRHGSLAHPETGEVPTFLFYMEKRGGAGTLRLKTDSQPLREHLAAKGLAVLGNVAEGDAGFAPAAAPAV